MRVEGRYKVLTFLPTLGGFSLLEVKDGGLFFSPF